MHRFLISLVALLLAAPAFAGPEALADRLEKGTGYVIIWGGGKDPEAARNSSIYLQTQPQYLMKPGFPAVIESTKIEGLNPGFHIVVMGFCGKKAQADRFLARANTDTSGGIYHRKSGQTVPGTCPTLAAKDKKKKEPEAAEEEKPAAGQRQISGTLGGIESTFTFEVKPGLAIVASAFGELEDVYELLAELVPSGEEFGPFVDTGEAFEELPLVISSSDLPGTKPGKEILLFGFCDTPEKAKAMVHALEGELEAGYEMGMVGVSMEDRFKVVKTKISMPGTCLEVDSP